MVCLERADRFVVAINRGATTERTAPAQQQIIASELREPMQPCMATALEKQRGVLAAMAEAAASIKLLRAQFRGL